MVIDAAGVRSGRVVPNREILAEEGFLVLNQLKTTLTPQDAAVLVSVDGEQFDFLSGPVVALQLRREGAYQHLAKLKNLLDDTYTSADAWTTLRDSRIFFPTPPTLERTLVLVKPEYSQEDYNKVLQKIDDNDFVLIGKLARIVSAEVAKDMFNGNQEDIDYVTSDVSVALVIEKIGAVDDWQLLMGPKDPKLAQQIAKGTLRAEVKGLDAVHNVVYGSESLEKARRDIAGLFPAHFAMERTLAVVKPDLIRNGHLHTIMDTIKANGFTILMAEEMNMSQKRCGLFYNSQKDKPNFSKLVDYMSSGPCMVMILGKPGAVTAWKKILGPENPAEARKTSPNSLIARFGLDDVCNGFHATETPEKAKEEIDFFFPQIKVESLPSLLEVEDYLNRKPPPRPYVEQRKSLNDVLTEGLIQLCRVKPTGNDAVTWLAQWLLRNNPNKPAIAEPQDAVATKSVLDQIRAKVGGEVKVVWAVGGAGSGRDEQVKAASDKYGYEVIDVQQLFATSEASGTEYGELIKDCKAKGRPVPIHVSVNLVQDALLNSTDKNQFIINGFPESLDEAFLFETSVGPVDKIVYFDCSDETKAKRKEKGSDVAFKASVYPVIDQYQLTGKVKKISTDGKPEEIAKRVKTHLA